MFFHDVNSFNKYTVLFRICSKNCTLFAFVFTRDDYDFVTFFNMHLASAPP